MNTNRHVISVLINKGQLADKVCRAICELSSVYIKFPNATHQVDHSVGGHQE